RVIQDQPPARPLFLLVAFNAPHTPLQPPPEYLQRYSAITDPNRRRYAAMVTCMDDGLGRVVDALEGKGVRRKTLLVFVSDNGGNTEAGASNDPLRGGKHSFYEGGLRVPALANWPGHLPEGTVSQEPCHIVDWYP